MLRNTLPDKKKGGGSRASSGAKRGTLDDFISDYNKSKEGAL